VSHPPHRRSWSSSSVESSWAEGQSAGLGARCSYAERFYISLASVGGGEEEELGEGGFTGGAKQSSTKLLTLA